MKSFEKILWPTLILGSGILLLLKAFGIGEEFGTFRVIGSLILLGLSLASLIRYQFFTFLVPLSLIAYLWRVQLGIADMDVKLLLGAALLLSIGLSLLFRRKTKPHWHSDHSDTWTKSEEILNENETVTIDASFSEQTKYIHASNLKKVQISCNFASAKVYFDQCQVSPEGLEINLNVHFAGVVLMIPANWRIQSHASVFAAEINDETRQGPDVVYLVRLTGSVNFAEVKIRTI
ncbi:MAG: hypothetical protein PHQ83_06790 [Eubacteriales bacterium]|nr:hypothetical protein [Eubacteriales bacterium]